MLRLVSSNEAPANHVEESLFQEAWKALPDTMKKRSDSRAKVSKVWDQHSKRCGGQKALLAALKNYLRADKDLPKSGGPGLQVWLRAEKYDHWTSSELHSDRPVPSYPQREALVSMLGEPFVISYLDSAKIEDNWVIPRTGMARDKLMEQKNALKAAGLVGIRQKT